MFRRLLDRFYDRNVAKLVTVMGTDNAGKTTMIYKIVTGTTVNTIPTIGFNIETVKVPTTSGKSFSTTLMDIGLGCGGRFHLQFVYQYYRNSEAIIWVVDAADSDAERLNESVDMLKSLFKWVRADPDPEAGKFKECPVLILANKRDKPGGLSSTTLRDTFEAVCKDHPFAVFPTSMTESISTGGLPEAFTWLQSELERPTSSRSAIAVPPPSDIIQEKRSPAALSEKLESWISRTETDSSPEEFLLQFEKIGLPAWDHYTHIRIAYTILITYGRQKGKNMIFDGIERYIAQSPDARGRTFHVSMTYFWIQLVHFGIRSMPPMYSISPSSSASRISLADSLTTLVEQPLKNKMEEVSSSLADFAAFLMLNPYVVDGNLWADYYSKDVLMSPGAKEGVVLPDKKALPNVVVRDVVLAAKKT